MLNRRGFISGAAALLAAPRIAFAGAETERRFVFIIQRGAADGLHTLIPYADPAYARLRGALAIDPTEALKLDGTFALHPSLTGIAGLYKAGQASLFHAVASPTAIARTSMRKMFWRRAARRRSTSRTAG